MLHTIRLAGLLTVLLAPLIGCEEEGIRVATVPVDPPRPTAALPDIPATPVDLAWDVPAGWRERPPQQGFTIADYDAGSADAPVRLTVTRLGGAGGGALANINRWRNQLGLPPVSSLPEQPMERVNTRDDQLIAGVVDLVGNAERTLGALLPRQDVDETWFFKMTGAPEAVGAQKDALIQMVQSIRLQSPAEEQAP